jgi:hypothetical protein
MRRTTTACRRPTPIRLCSTESVDRKRLPRLRREGVVGIRLLGDEAADEPEFEPIRRVADGSFIGDYSQIAMGTDGKAHASWTDFRGNPGTTPPNQDVLVANFKP